MNIRLICGMILIADSGSTKTNWQRIDSESINYEPIFTSGISPFYQTEANIFTSLERELLPEIDKVPKAIFFYGTGCSQPERNKRVHDALQKLFPGSSIEIEHDLLAAARATCGKQPGITAILGTGSNSCLFDGEQISDNVPSLGFLLGDEGSAGSLGRKLLQAYFYRELPADLENLLKAAYNMDKATVLNSVYENQKPNEIVASYARFLSQHNGHTFIKKLLHDGFSEFLERHVMKYNGAKNYPVHFIGSMAFNNQEILKGTLKEKGLKTGRIIQSPMEGLIQFHLNK